MIALIKKSNRELVAVVETIAQAKAVRKENSETLVSQPVGKLTGYVPRLSR